MNEKSVVEEALLQIKAVENAISENAKGILASTMKEEISELVRESLGVSRTKNLREQDEQDPNMDTEDEEEVDVEEPEMDVEDEGEIEGEEPEVKMPSVDMLSGDNQTAELPPLDMTQSPIGDVMKVFKLMGDEDGIIVKKDEKGIHLSDPSNDVEYLIQMGDESENPQDMMENEYIDALRNGGLMGEEFGEEQPVFELELDDVDMEEPRMSRRHRDMDMEEPRMSRRHRDMDMDMEEPRMPRRHRDMDMDMEEPRMPRRHRDMGMEETYGMDETYGMEETYGMDEMYDMDETYGMDETIYEVDKDELESVLESFKAIGIGFGKPGNGFAKTSVNQKGFNGNKTSGGKGKTGNGPKFKYPSIKHGVTEVEMEEEEFEGWSKEEENEGMIDSPETTEASRTLGNGRKFGRKGLPKPRTAPRHLNVESTNKELSLLREKNEEYRKALDFFRTKLNEVAVFNSNLAYSTRLFTEQSTTKQEKINILRRFDSVESLKESKSLYQTIKKELDGKGTESMVTESIQRKVIKTPQTGSSSNLIESKTYENPQFMRMKDLMTKIK